MRRTGISRSIARSCRAMVDPPTHMRAMAELPCPSCLSSRAKGGKRLPRGAAGFPVEIGRAVGARKRPTEVPGLPCRAHLQGWPRAFGHRLKARPCAVAAIAHVEAPQLFHGVSFCNVLPTIENGLFPAIKFGCESRRSDICFSAAPPHLESVGGDSRDDTPGESVRVLRRRPCHMSSTARSEFPLTRKSPCNRDARLPQRLDSNAVLRKQPVPVAAIKVN